MDGPYRRFIEQYSLPTSWGYRAVMFDLDRRWYRRPLAERKLGKPNPFSLTVREQVSDTEFPSNGTSDVIGFTNEKWLPAYNKAYKKLVGKLGDQSQWGVNLAEYRQAESMIVKRSTQIVRFARRLNKFDFLGAAKELGLVVHKSKPPRGLREQAKSFGDNFLEYHFGWEPLVKDIGAAVETLQSPVKTGKIVGTASDIVTEYDNFTVGAYHYSHRRVWDSHARLQARVNVTNPNLYLANQLGFLNPLAVAWELVPFSFVVDWFANVGDVLSSFTDFAGVTLIDPFHTKYQTTEYGYSASGPSYYRASLSRGTFVNRVVGDFAAPSLALKAFHGFSVIRGATAIALLTQFLGRK